MIGSFLSPRPTSRRACKTAAAAATTAAAAQAQDRAAIKVIMEARKNQKSPAFAASTAEDGDGTGAADAEGNGGAAAEQKMCPICSGMHHRLRTRRLQLEFKAGRF